MSADGESSLPVYTADEVARHCTATDCWTIIHSGVYNVTDYLAKHPGGAKLILKVAGADGTRDFEALFHSARARAVLDTLKIGVVPHAGTEGLLNPNLISRMPTAGRTGPYGLPLAGQKTGPYGLPLLPGQKTEQKTGPYGLPWPASRSSPAFATAKLVSAETRTPTTRLYRFSSEQALADIPPGHHLTFYLPARGVKRHYTPVQAGRHSFDVLIKHYAGGVMSSHVAAMQPGDTLQYTGPNGTFVFPAGRRRLLMLAGGTGVAPFYTVLLDMAERRRAGQDVAAVLIYSAKTADELLLRDQLAMLVHMLPLTIVETLTQAATDDDLKCRRGRIDTDLLEQQHDITDTLICGPQPFNDAMRSLVSATKNLRESQIHLFQ